MTEAEECPKILVLASTVPSRPGDGTPEFVLSLCRALADSYDITLLCPRAKDSPMELVVDGVKIRRFRYFPRPLEGLADGAIVQNLKVSPWRVIEVPTFFLAFVMSAVRLIRKTRAQLVHAHWIIPGGSVALIARLLTGTAYIVTAHGVDVFGLRSRPFRWLKKRVIQHAAVTSVASREMGNVLGIPRDELADLVVPMGVDAAGIRERVGTRRPQKGRFLFVGRLADKKGVDVLIAAVARIPEAGLVILGDGPDRPKLEAVARSLGIADRVEFRGRADGREVIDELRVAFCTVVPSRVGAGGDADSTPLTMSESMAAGVPVIASRLGGLAETISSGENGILVEPGSVDDLTDAMQGLLSASAEDLERLTDAAWERMQGRLDIRYTRDRYDAFLQEALRRTTDPQGRIRKGASRTRRKRR